MSVNVWLSNSNRSLKEHLDKQMKRWFDSSGLLLSTLSVNAPQSASLQKTEACQERVRGRCVIVKEAQHKKSKGEKGRQR